MEYFCCVLRRHLIKKFKDVNANALFIGCYDKCLKNGEHQKLF